MNEKAKSPAVILGAVAVVLVAFATWNSDIGRYQVVTGSNATGCTAVRIDAVTGQVWYADQSLVSVSGGPIWLDFGGLPADKAPGKWWVSR